jgi:hypothetical protein
MADELKRKDTAARTLPDAAICGPGKREPVWVHGSLSAGARGDGRKVETVTRGEKVPDCTQHGATDC